MIEITKKIVKSSMPMRKENSNKGDFGKLFCITGSNEYIGAGLLSALSALKVGAGYSVLCSEKNAIEHYKKISPDLIYKSHENFNFDIIIKLIEQINPNAIVFGCGIGLNDKTIELTEKLINFLKPLNIPTVIDADGLNCLAQLNQTKIGPNFSLTPHPKELSRLIKKELDDILQQRAISVLLAQEKYNCSVILKGHHTLVCTPEQKIYENKTGNSALAKAGTGDVLAGMIGGFLSQNTSVENAQIISVYLHGLAADIYKKDFSEYSMLASDLLQYIPKAIKEILG